MSGQVLVTASEWATKLLCFYCGSKVTHKNNQWKEGETGNEADIGYSYTDFLMEQSSTEVCCTCPRPVASRHFVFYTKYTTEQECIRDNAKCI